MPRNLTTAMKTALQASIQYPALFVQATFVSETIYMWTGSGSVTWNSQTWTGLGSVLGVSTPEDSATVEAKGITLSVSGIDPTLLPEAMTDFGLGLPVFVYLGLYTGLGGTLIDGPVIAWAGRMDKPTFNFSGTEAMLEINCENRLLDMNIGVDRRYTNQDCQMEFPGDLGFQFVDGLQQKNLFWGEFPASTNNL